MARPTFTPVHKEDSPGEVYQIQRFGDMFMLYMIDRNVKSHTLLWTGRIDLSDLIDWDERLVNLTRPESEKKVPRYTRQCLATLELATTQKDVERYLLKFDHDEYGLVRGLARSNLQRADIIHFPFDLSVDDERSAISIAMHNYAPFPQETFEFYRQTRLTDTTILRSDQQHILDRIAKLAQPAIV